MKQALHQIETLLRQYQHPYEANLAAIVREQAKTDILKACQLLDSDEWWADRDSIASIDLAIEGGFSPESRKHAQTLRHSLTTLAAHMEHHHIHNEEATLTASQFNKWEVSHI
ncbi:MAG: hypothetical protein ACWA5X_11545 [bacterium]